MNVIYSEALNGKKFVVNFIACRLKEARCARSLTQRALADRIGKSPKVISSWESGKKFPEFSEIEKLAKVTALPENFFLRPRMCQPDHLEYPMFFRSMASITKRMRERSEVRLRWTQEISHSLQRWVDLPALSIPQIDARDYHEISDQDIERLASKCRKVWELGEGPISDVMLALENAGIIIARDYMKTVKMDGVSNWSELDNRPYILVAREKATCVRSRMDVAHELGHLVLHQHIHSSALNKKENFKEIERQAFYFATAFLMPSEGFISEIFALTPEALSTLKNRWKVSIAAMMMRCKDLDIVSQDRAETFWRHYNFRGWRRKEPLDSMLPVEEPRLLRRSVKLIVESGVRSKRDLLDDFSLNDADVEGLCSLSSGYMTSKMAEVANINALAHRSPRGKTETQSMNSAKILKFERKGSNHANNIENLKEDHSIDRFPTEKSYEDHVDKNQS